MAVDFESHLEGISKQFLTRAEKIPYSAIDLPPRARHAIEASGATNSLDALRFIIGGFPGVRGIGATTIAESQAAVYKFIQAVESASDEELKTLVDPRETHFSSANGNFLHAFPAIVELYLDKQSGSNAVRNKDILHKRFALHGEKRYTLEDIGTYYDVTRERIRQIEEKTIKGIDYLLSGQLKTRTWKLDDLLVKNYLSFKKRIDSQDILILKHEIDSILMERFDSLLESGYMDLLMEAAGYIKIPESIDGFRGTIKAAWCHKNRYRKNEIESIFRAVDAIFDNAASVSLFELTVMAKKRFRKEVSNDSVLLAVRSCNEIEIVDDRVRVKFVFLRSAADKAYRILEASKKPLHFSIIAREINLLNKEIRNYKPVRETNVKNQLVADPRFSTTGKSGVWGLSTWDFFENLTIVDAIQKVLHRAGSPMGIQDITRSVIELRPDISNNSVSAYLNRSEKFCRVGPSEYALTTWRLKPIKRTVQPASVPDSEFFAVVKAELVRKNPIPFPELIRAVMSATGLKQARVRYRILQCPHLDVQERQGLRCKSVSCKDIDFEFGRVGEVRELLRDKVQVEIRSILCESPNVPMKKGDLYKAVLRNVSCLRPTFYHYLEEMSDIRSFRQGNEHYAVYEHKEEVERIEIRLDGYNIGHGLESELERALNRLTLEEVDIGLFELGRIFENCLRAYLSCAHENSVINVRRKDTDSLANMINCVVREGVVTKGHHLDTLREERNSRAHGETPSAEEQKSLFNKAHYIADLFVKYIVFLDEKRAEIEV